MDCHASENVNRSFENGENLPQYILEHKLGLSVCQDEGQDLSCLVSGRLKVYWFLCASRRVVAVMDT